MIRAKDDYEKEFMYRVPREFPRTWEVYCNHEWSEDMKPLVYNVMRAPFPHSERCILFMSEKNMDIIVDPMLTKEEFLKKQFEALYAAFDLMERKLTGQRTDHLIVDNPPVIKIDMASGKDESVTFVREIKQRDLRR